MLRAVGWGVVLLWLAGQAVAAPYQPGYTVLRSEATYDVRPDGGYTEDLQEDLRLNTQSGVEALSQYAIRFSASLQSVKVLEAYTRLPDGRRLPVSRSGMLLQQSSESADAPMFDDAKVLNVVFPALAPGATMHIRFRRVQRVALFPGVFALQAVYSRFEDRESSVLTLRAPASMPLQVESIDVPGGEVAPDRAGTRRWRWTLGVGRAEAPENDAISDVDFSPRISVSSLSGYAQLAEAYRSRAESRAAVTPEIRRLANQITDGIAAPREQAEALYRWVSKNIRYVGIYFGFGGVVPHEAEAIAHARYGDCKDHVTLYQALLAAKGIKSSPVLVNAEQSWWLSKVAVPTGSFNHAINYLPQWDLFVDTTAQFAPFGVLPDSEAGKQALVIDDGHGRARLMRLPLTRPESDRLAIDSQMTLQADGRLQGQSRVRLNGVYDLMARSTFSNVTPGTEEATVARMLSARGLQGGGSLLLGNAYDLSQPYAYRFDFDLPDYADTTGPVGVVLPSGHNSIISLAAMADWGGVATRRYPMMLDNGVYEENTQLSLPPGMRVLALPRAVNEVSALGRYQASYHQDGHLIRVTRRLTLSGNEPVLPPQRYPLLRQLTRSVARDLRAQILLEPK